MKDYHIFEDDKVYELDRRIVPMMLLNEDSYCFVFEINDIPAAIQGKYNNRTVTYAIEDTYDGLVSPSVK